MPLGGNSEGQGWSTLLPREAELVVEEAEGLDVLEHHVGVEDAGDHLLAEGRDVGRGDVQRKVGDRARDIAEQARTVETLDLAFAAKVVRTAAGGLAEVLATPAN